MTIAFRWIAAILFVAAGVNHFLMPVGYQRIVPPSFPWPDILVAVSGVAELVGGIGLLIRPLRIYAGWGLIALLIAVFPANVYMATDRHRLDLHIAPWLLWARLPLQGVLVAWVWAVSRGGSRSVAASS